MNSKDAPLESFAARRQRLWAEAQAAFERWFAVPHREEARNESWRAGYVSALMDRVTVASTFEDRCVQSINAGRDLMWREQSEDDQAKWIERAMSPESEFDANN